MRSSNYLPPAFSVSPLFVRPASQRQEPGQRPDLGNLIPLPGGLTQAPASYNPTLSQLGADLGAWWIKLRSPHGPVTENGYLSQIQVALTCARHNLPQRRLSFPDEYRGYTAQMPRHLNMALEFNLGPIWTSARYGSDTQAPSWSRAGCPFKPLPGTGAQLLDNTPERHHEARPPCKKAPRREDLSFLPKNLAAQPHSDDSLPPIKQEQAESAGLSNLASLPSGQKLFEGLIIDLRTSPVQPPNYQGLVALIKEWESLSLFNHPGDIPSAPVHALKAAAKKDPELLRILRSEFSAYVDLVRSETTPDPQPPR
ncbi:MAG: hypothetical protein Q7U75_15525 [Desulfobacterales bacterium]|nr:hypothetical protein [Desulfobacterales bacterium]